MVKINDEEVEFLFGLSAKEGTKYILEHFPVKLAFVTCGADGCFFRHVVAQGFVPSLQGIQAKDTTSARDIFGGNAVWKLLQYGLNPTTMDEPTLRDVVTFACTSAGLSTTQSGSISSVPDYETVQKYIL